MSEEKQTKGYKDTLNLPSTPFAMKANLAQREPEMLKTWNEEKVYESLREQAKGKDPYILHDGPPYANGKIHIGHALNKVLKDIIVRFKTLTGHDSYYVPGWDCHGLPIEHQCLKNMGKRKEEVERVEFRKQARAYAEEFVGIQREEFKRLGIFGEWEKPYLTMNYEYQASIAESFLKIYEKGYIYQGLKPVPWCFDCETALADAELEYQDKTSQAVYVKFPIDSKSFQSKVNIPEVEGKKIYYVVWTTTPWTLPANVGVALHPDLTYSIVPLHDEVWVLAESRVPHVRENLDLGFEVPECLKGVKGQELEGVMYDHPFLERKGKTILADYVSSEDGTGIVHIAPGHGEDDYFYGYVKNKLDILSPVDNKGRFSKDFPQFEGQHVFKANAKIAELLGEKRFLISEEKHEHSYPHCWRCKKPIIFRATSQWFMRIDHLDLRKKMTKAIFENIQFTPDWGKKRIGSMVESRPEWCLSRQRYWGVPIPVIGCKNCADAFFISESKQIIVETFEKEGADSWFSKEAADFLPDGFKCSGCHKSEFVKAEDIIDVWFDSGVSHQAVLKKTKGLKYPAELYLEGSDQHRGWFQSSLTTSVALEDKPPFQGVLTHGFVVDGEGKKMSKSAGNVVAPQDVMKEFGADILRLWVSSVDYEYDIRLSKNILKQLADSYRKIRNTFRYVLGNINDFNLQEHGVAIKDMHEIDQWAIAATDEIVEKVREKYERFEFHQIYQMVHNFCVVELSGYYLDLLKDTLYTAAKNSQIRRSAQTALHYVLSRLVKILAPILPFTMDEVWRAYELDKETKSVHCSQWESGKSRVSNEIFQKWSDVRQIRNAVTPFLEMKREAKEIGSNLEAKVFLRIEHEKAAEMIKSLLPELSRVFVVSQVEWLENESSDVHKSDFESIIFKEKIAIQVAIQKAEGEKCARCWIFAPEVGKDSEHPSLCGKCLQALKNQ